MRALYDDVMGKTSSEEWNATPPGMKWLLRRLCDAIDSKVDQVNQRITDVDREICGRLRVLEKVQFRGKK